MNKLRKKWPLGFLGFLSFLALPQYQAVGMEGLLWLFWIVWFLYFLPAHKEKTLKFTPDLCAKILEGSKTSTWRLFDDKNLQVGDELIFVNSETLEPFGTAQITSLRTKTLGSLEEEDWVGHEQFPSEEDMYATYGKYYGNRVEPDTEVKIIQFEFQKQQSR